MVNHRYATYFDTNLHQLKWGIVVVSTCIAFFFLFVSTLDTARCAISGASCDLSAQCAAAAAAAKGAGGVVTCWSTARA